MNVNYSKTDLRLGMMVATKDDYNDSNWGQIRAIGKDKIQAYYVKEDETYEIDYWLLYAVTTGEGDSSTWVTPTGQGQGTVADFVLPSQAAVGADPFADVADDDDDDNDTAAPAASPSTVRPGFIVTYKMTPAQARKYKVGLQRLWVVLNYTKGSRRSAVNIALVNGKQPGEAFPYDYMRVPIGSCTVVKFGSYEKVIAK